MIINVYTIYDVKAEAYHQPFYAASRGIAIRLFTEAANDKKINIGKYPADYTLFEIGYWDDSNAEFKCHPTLIPLGLALEYISQDSFETTALGGKLKKKGDSVEYTYPSDTE